MDGWIFYLQCDSMSGAVCRPQPSSLYEKQTATSYYKQRNNKLMSSVLFCHPLNRLSHVVSSLLPFLSGFHRLSSTLPFPSRPLVPALHSQQYICPALTKHFVSLSETHSSVSCPKFFLPLEHRSPRFMIRGFDVLCIYSMGLTSTKWDSDSGGVRDATSAAGLPTKLKAVVCFPPRPP